MILLKSILDRLGPHFGALIFLNELYDLSLISSIHFGSFFIADILRINE